MLSIDPAFRSRRIGRTLTEECLRRAARDSTREVALHTSEIMKVALPMYLRMGFAFWSDAPPIYGIA
jgi:ribosomal protein S18 acetylase RimI-like enzyme